MYQWNPVITSWLIHRFQNMSTPAGLFYAKENLTIMVTKYTKYKNHTSQW